MPVKVSQTFWKVHPFSDAFLRKKKSQTSSKGHKPFPPTLLPEDTSKIKRKMECQSELKIRLSHTTLAIRNLLPSPSPPGFP